MSVESKSRSLRKTHSHMTAQESPRTHLLQVLLRSLCLYQSSLPLPPYLKHLPKLTRAYVNLECFMASGKNRSASVQEQCNVSPVLRDLFFFAQSMLLLGLTPISFKVFLMQPCRLSIKVHGLRDSSFTLRT